MKISLEIETVRNETITLESVLDMAVILAMISIARRESDLLETIKIKLDDLTRTENLYPNRADINKILDELELIESI